jgi:L-threonylcarbamoyladenylate synthase
MPTIDLASVNDRQLVDQLQTGAVGVLPTDTVYGLVCSARNREALDRLFIVKPREAKPGTVIAASVEQLVELGLHKRYLTAVAQYWPAPLSVVIPCGQELDHVHRGLNSIAVRIPADEALNRLLIETGPLMTTSANMPGEATAQTIAEAKQYFGDAVDFYVDGGDLSNRPPSTIIRVVDDAIEILRAGAVTIDENGRITE